MELISCDADIAWYLGFAKNLDLARARLVLRASNERADKIDTCLPEAGGEPADADQSDGHEEISKKKSTKNFSKRKAKDNRRIEDEKVSLVERGFKPNHFGVGEV